MLPTAVRPSLAQQAWKTLEKVQPMRSSENVGFLMLHPFVLILEPFACPVHGSTRDAFLLLSVWLWDAARKITSFVLELDAVLAKPFI